MSQKETARNNAGQIPALIAERDRYQQWLDALESERGDIPDHIYERIAADYAARLENAVDTLRTHVGELEERLAERRAELAEVVESLASRNDELVEGRIRHQVGEYDDKRWASIEKELAAAIEEAKQRQAALEAEIRRLEGVLVEVRQPALTTVEVSDTPFLQALAAASEQAVTDDSNGRASRRNGASRSTAADGAARDGELAPVRARKPTGLRTLRCDKCGSFNLPEAMFCEGCGDDLPAP